jgi:hypothetical protein
LTAASFSEAAFAAACAVAAFAAAAFFVAAAFAAAAFFFAAAALLLAWDGDTAETRFAAAESAEDAAWLVEAAAVAATPCPAACSAEGVRLQPVSDSAPMLMAMAIFLLSKKPLRAHGCRAEGSHNLGGKEMHKAFLGPGRRSRGGLTAALRIRKLALAPGGPSGAVPSGTGVNVT